MINCFFKSRHLYLWKAQIVFGDESLGDCYMKYNAGKAEMMLNKWDTIKSDWTQENVSGKGNTNVQ